MPAPIKNPLEAGLGRRDFLRLTGAAGALTGMSLAAADAQDVAAARITPQPANAVTSGDPDTADILIETLVDWGVSHVFGIVGDGINPIIEGLRKRQDRIAFVGVRHEESAAFMATSYAKHTGRLGVCLATTGPGAAHTVNGLYDAAKDNAPVLVITGSTFHDLAGLHFMQGLDTVKLME